MPFKNPHPFYSVWASMRNRCRNPRFHQFRDYGGRGITICDRWDSFAAFVEDMGPRPDGFLLDRKDNDGPYSPDNCRWASRSDQQRNQRRAVYVTIEGKRYRAIELADIAGIKTDFIVARAKRGLSYADVIRPERFRWTGPRAKGLKPRKTHCPQGHEYTAENTIIVNRATGTRACRICHNARVSALYFKQKASK